MMIIFCRDCKCAENNVFVKETFSIIQSILRLIMGQFECEVHFTEITKSDSELCIRKKGLFDGLCILKVSLKLFYL